MPRDLSSRQTVPVAQHGSRPAAARTAPTSPTRCVIAEGFRPSVTGARRYSASSTGHEGRHRPPAGGGRPGACRRPAPGETLRTPDRPDHPRLRHGPAQPGRTSSPNAASMTERDRGQAVHRAPVARPRGPDPKARRERPRKRQIEPPRSTRMAVAEAPSPVGLRRRLVRRGCWRASSTWRASARWASSTPRVKRGRRLVPAAARRRQGQGAAHRGFLRMLPLRECRRRCFS